MKYKIKILVMLALILIPGINLFAAMDFMLEESLAKSLDRVEALYNKHEWDEAIKVARGILNDSPPNTPIRFRAHDLIVLSIDAKNKEAIKLIAKEKLNTRISGAKSMMAKGQKYLTEKNYSMAAKSFSIATKNNAADAESFYLLGYSLLKSGSKKSAYTAFKRCLKLNKNHSRALFNITGLSFAFNYTNEAEQYSRKLIDTIDNRMEELKEIFIEQKGQRLNDKAIETAKKMAGLKSNLGQATYMHGILSEKKGDYKSAVKSFKRASEIQPTSADTWYHFGKSLLKMNVFHQASIAIQQAIYIQESKLVKLKNIAGKLLDEGKEDAAVAAEIKTKNLKAQIANYLYVVAIANGKKKETDLAIRNLTKAIKLKPKFTKAKYARAIYLAEKNRFEEAITEMRDILKISEPKSAQSKKVIKTITFLMDMLAKRDNPTIYSKAKKQNKEIKVNEYVKDMPGLEGKKQERRWEDIFPALKNIQNLITMRNYPEAIRRLLYIRTKHPEVADIHAILGQCYMQEGRFADAKKCYKQTLDLDPKHAGALADLAYIYASMGEKLDTALKLVQQAIKLKGFTPEYVHTLGWVLFKTGEVKQSITAFQKAIALKPDYTLAHYNLGLSFYISKNYASALDEFETVLAKTPKHNKALLFKAISLAKIKKVPEALKTLEDLRGILPKDATLGRVVGDLHAKLKLADERHTDLPIPQIKSPAPIEKLMAEAAEFRSKGLVTRAKEKYFECHRLAPDRFEPYYELGMMYASSSLNKPALTTWEKCEKLNPNYFPLQLNMGMVLHKLSQRDKARTHFVKAQGLDEKSPQPKYYLGLMAFEDKRFESAESHALGALRLKPKFFKAMALLGMSRIRLGRLKPARDIYEALYAKAPSGSSIKRHARKQIWEITKLMAPSAYPSIEAARDTAKIMVAKAKGDVKLSKKVTERDSFKEYGKNTMTPDDKLWVLRRMGDFSSVAMPALASPIKKTITPETLSNSDKKWVVDRVTSFNSQKNKYSMPSSVKKSQYALKETTEVKKRTPLKSDDITMAALSLAEKGQTAKALVELDKALELSPTNPEILINIGYLNTLVGNFKNAFDAFATAVAHHPNNNLAHLALGNLYWLGGKGDKALEEWKLISGSINLNQDFIFMARAENVWKRVLEIQPTDIDAHSNLGLVYLFSGKMKSAIAEFQAVTSLDSNRQEHDFYTAQAYIIMYLQNKNNKFKTEAKNILVKLKKGYTPFPHAKTLISFVRSL